MKDSRSQWRTGADNCFEVGLLPTLEFMSDHAIIEVQRMPDASASTALADVDLPMEPPRTGRAAARWFPMLAGVLAALTLLVSAALTAATPAQAAVSYRDLKSIRYGTCVYAYGDPLEDTYLKGCSTTPAMYGNWQVVVEGSYNNHPLWVVRRQSGNCLGVGGNASSSYIYVSCSTGTYSDWWEVFTTSTGRYVLKSYGAWRHWGQHKCLTFAASGGSGSVKLGSCSLTSTADMIYR
ncbi:hypothetical protein [Actinoplanes sp. NPDC026619]|uniref:hypothetical protein n=1 Tax=Actinoplanes sp. NPDC026619 TaxID=3155798 RepID=UPI0033E68C05